MSEEDGRRPPDSHINTKDGLAYWQSIDADVNGMLGGFPQVSRIDLQSSRNLLAKFGIGTKPGLSKVKTALEGGAGIGRITEGLLLNVAEQVDVVEPIAKFTANLQGKAGVRHVFNMGLEQWQPRDDDVYDLIWTQWCVGHLTDEQLVQYLGRCKTVLRPGSGLLVLKENLSTDPNDIFDESDSSVTRTDEKFLALIAQAGLRVVKAEIQKGFPQDLFPVKMYALKPADT
ncbi:hypothetical protein GQ53DRAFT_744226 [Thozetella sp. PMI_491]|nr:hypothetical protein GQ53DRAFT_744226 [Thozetella sp. PMI_491]